MTGSLDLCPVVDHFARWIDQHRRADRAYRQFSIKVLLTPSAVLLEDLVFWIRKQADFQLLSWRTSFEVPLQQELVLPND